MTERPETMPDKDVVDLLLRQHMEIRALFGEVAAARGDARAAAFDRLRRMLAVHETAEEEVVHPYARRLMDGGGPMVDARLEEENRGKTILAELVDIGPGGKGFGPRFEELRTAVLEHARREEEEEFPRIRELATAEERRGMAAAVKAAQVLAPTRPHPGVESASANLLVGPFAAVADRTRDAVRKAAGRRRG
ncbi:hemerythrin domain-containing protein [Actinomadura rugatobispora]|uniref:Hemerythrin domain-containing protein n=1 Tax=Actinomadura rugatobispora TaxID=1994 RepID=A0ABW1AK71_9ACTN|nr:hemerythrin domain-containing protein [Actinomadura rugatobispora]